MTPRKVDDEKSQRVNVTYRVSPKNHQRLLEMALAETKRRGRKITASDLLNELICGRWLDMNLPQQ